MQNHAIPRENRSTAFLEAHRGITEAGDSRQPAFEFYAGPPDPAGHAWRAFTPDTAAEEAAACFARRYGRNPDFVFQSRGLLLAGPVSEV